MTRSIRTVIKLFFIIVVAVLLLYSVFFVLAFRISSEVELIPNENFKRDLVANLISAEKITITEHSELLDWSREDYEATATKVKRKVDDSEQEVEMLVNTTLPTIVYKELELNLYERLRLLVLIKFFAVGKANAPSLCMFSSHHELNFYYSDTTKKILDVCFKCKQTMWNNDSANAPLLMYEVLQYEINSLGMRAERNWPEYLNQWRKSHPIELKAN